MKLLIYNIKCLVHFENQIRLKFSGNEMRSLNSMEDAFVLIDGERIHSFGKSTAENLSGIRKENVNLDEINAYGKMVFPAWCDAHTHLVYASSRENEFVDRIKGMTYETIAERPEEWGENTSDPNVDLEEMDSNAVEIDYDRRQD